MKGLIIFLLLIIISVMGYDQYQKHQRFNPKNANYVAADMIDTAYYNQKVVIDYYQSIETLNGYIISQWSTNRIDVRNPKKDNDATTFAVNEYREKLGQVKYFEAILKKSAVYKSQGLSNNQIKTLETDALTPQVLAEQQKQKEFRRLFEEQVSKKPLKKGNTGPWVYELQKHLIRKNYDIEVDGKFKEVTYHALKDFEQNNQLYPDGILDVLTLTELLKPTKINTQALLATD